MLDSDLIKCYQTPTVTGCREATISRPSVKEASLRAVRGSNQIKRLSVSQEKGNVSLSKAANPTSAAPVRY